MNTATAKLGNLRIAPRKVRLLADAVRGKSVPAALTLLNALVKKGSLPVAKLLRSAAANAKQQFHADERNLRIAKMSVDEGPKLKRWMPRSRGQSYQIQKKTSHITVVLEEQARENVPAHHMKESVKEKEVKEGKEKQGATEAKKPVFRKRAQKEFAQKSIAGMKRIFRRKSI